MATVRYDSAADFSGVNLDRVKKAAPSVFAKNASPKMSERYAFISTAEMIKPLLDEGFIITMAMQRATRARDPMFTRHMLRLRQSDVKPVVGDVFPEIVLTNAHDGQSRYIMHGGLFRLACSNGMVTTIIGSDLSIVHRGVPANLIEQAQEVIEQTRQLKKIVQTMNRKEMTEQQMAVFANQAAALAYDEPNFEPKLLLEQRRAEDKGNSVWKVFNRVQENVMRGGITFQSRASGRQFSTRGLSHIGRTIDFNKELWQLAEKAAA